MRFQLAGPKQLKPPRPGIRAWLQAHVALLPALVFVSARYVFGLEPLLVAVATISAAMPSGVNAFVLAMRYEMLIARIAASLIVTTALAWATAAALLAWLLPGIR